MADNPLSGAARRNIAAVRDLATEVRRGRTRIDRITDAISGFAGSPRFLLAQVLVVSGWVVLNAFPWFGRIDPFPFEFLNFVSGGRGHPPGHRRAHDPKPAGARSG